MALQNLLFIGASCDVQQQQQQQQQGPETIPYQPDGPGVKQKAGEDRIFLFEQVQNKF